MPSIYFSEWQAHHIYWGMSILPYHGKNLYEALHTQGYRDQLLYFAAHVRRVITPTRSASMVKLSVLVSV